MHSAKRSSLCTSFLQSNSSYRYPEALDDACAEPKRGKILLADDNSDMREYVCSLLQRKWECVAVGDGLEALTTLQNNPGYFDLVLSDIMVSSLFFSFL